MKCCIHLDIPREQWKICWKLSFSSVIERIDNVPRRGRGKVEHLSTLEKIFPRLETVGLKETLYL